nr:hypothetical protein [Cytophagales bacterium]
MVNYDIELKLTKFRSFDRFSKFVLIGNNIDGWVDIGIVKFETFQEVIEKLPAILENFTCAGEWHITLYQVSDNYKIKQRYGYYKYPTKGRLIFELTYDRYPLDKIKLYVANSLIHFCFIGKEVDENWDIDEGDEETEFLDLSFNEFYWSIHLIEKNPIKNIKNHEFKLSPESYHRVIYGEPDEYF